jgi:hypothetical protein
MNNMSNSFWKAFIISIVYFIARFIEMRFIIKENKPLKILVRDTFIVYFSVIIGDFLLEQMNSIVQLGGQGINNTIPVFIDEPKF